MTEKVSYYRHFGETGKTKTIESVIKAIKNGQFKKQITELREFLKKGDEESYGKGKKHLSGFTSTGIFAPLRNDKNNTSYSKIITLDLDKVGDDLADIKAKAIQIEETFSCFISPSGKGLKILVKIDTDAKDHKVAYNIVKNWYSKKLNIEFDEKTVDISRLCYVSYDEDTYLNLNSGIFKTSKTLMKKKILQAYKIVKNKKLIYKKGGRNNYVHLFAYYCNLLGIPEKDTLQHLYQEHKSKDDGLESNELETIVKSAYKNDKIFGTFKESSPLETTSALTKEEYDDFIEKNNLTELSEFQFLRLYLDEEKEDSLTSLVDDNIILLQKGFSNEIAANILSNALNEGKDTLEDWDKAEFPDLYLKPTPQTSDFHYSMALNVIILAFKADKIQNLYQKVVLKSKILKKEQLNDKQISLKKLKEIHTDISTQIEALVSSFNENELM